jgi:hypothetical protein
MDSIAAAAAASRTALIGRKCACDPVDLQDRMSSAAAAGRMLARMRPLLATVGRSMRDPEKARAGRRGSEDHTDRMPSERRYDKGQRPGRAAGRRKSASRIHAMPADMAGRKRRDAATST